MSSTDSHLVRDWLRRSTRVGRPTGELVRLDSDGFEPTSAPTPGVRLVEGSPQAIPLPASSVNLVLCTEIMSRLSAVPFDATTTANPTLSQGLAPAVAHAIETYELTHLPGRAWYNLGAWKLVEQIHRVLRPGGRAILVDRGELEPSTSSDTRNDPGSSDVHFGHLVEVARALGMEARTLPLPEFLDVRVQSQWLSKSSYEALEARMKTAKTAFSPRAWTPETLNLPWPVEGIHWVGLADEGPGPLLTRMTVLLLRKP